MSENKAKQNLAKTINEIHEKVQEVFFDLEQFKGIDTADEAHKTAIKLMNDISAIHRRILQGGGEACK